MANVREVRIGGEGIGLGTLLAVLFIGLKLGKVITWPWLWVLAPLWIPFAIVVIIAILVVLIVALKPKPKPKRRF